MSVRPPASAFLCIDSEDRYQLQSQLTFNDAGTPGNDFRIQKNQPLLYGLFRRVGLVQVQLQYRVPTVVPDVNDQFVLVDNTNQDYYIITLTSGFYTASELAAEIQTQVLDISGNPFTGFTCTYEPSTGGLVMTNTAVEIALNNVTGGPYTAEQEKRWSLGFKLIGGYQGAFGNLSQTLTLGTPQLLFTKYIDIVSSRLAKFQRVKDGDTLLTNKDSILYRVYLTAPNTRSDPFTTCGPFDICVDPNTAKHSMWSIDEAIYELDFRLYDENGDLLYWTPGNNTEFQITLLASET